MQVCLMFLLRGQVHIQIRSGSVAVRGIAKTSRGSILADSKKVGGAMLQAWSGGFDGEHWRSRHKILLVNLLNFLL